MSHRIIATGAILLACATLAAAQEATTGSLAGRVVDAQGLPMPGVTVTVSSDQGSRTFVTDEQGQFLAPFLTPGAYTVRAELSGFRPVEMRDIGVALGQRASVPNITLRIGGVQEQVEVVGAPPVVDTTTAGVGATLEVTSSRVSPCRGSSATRSISRQA